jgi:membrane-associated phospholipid phosphatase
VIFVSFMTYSWFRKTYFQQSPEEGFHNALEVIGWQRELGIAVTRVELPMQEWVLERGWLIDFFNIYYQNFKLALYLSAIVCLVLAPAGFRRIWQMFMIATLIAVPWYALYPLAPPRFMEPFGYPFVDTLVVYAGVQSSAEGVGGANQFAAMPSMHIGWSVFAALWLAAALPRWRIGAVLGGLHLALMCVTVVVTGNHYVLDIIGGFIVSGTAIALGCLLTSEWAKRWWLERRRGRRFATDWDMAR